MEDSTRGASGVYRSSLTTRLTDVQSHGTVERKAGKISPDVVLDSLAQVECPARNTVEAGKR